MNEVSSDAVDILTTSKVDSVDTYDTTRFDDAALYKLESYFVKMIVDNEKLETVDFDCAILIYPTVQQIDDMKKVEGEDDFYIWRR